MTPEHRRYIAVEMAIAAVINAVLSAAFAFLVFGGRSQIGVNGVHGIVFDAVPQTFMIALMSCVVPTILTHRRVASRAVMPLPSGLSLPRTLLVRAILVAVLSSVLAVVAQAIVLPRFGASWSFAQLIAFKCVYGALLGAAIAAVAVRAALADPAN